MDAMILAKATIELCVKDNFNSREYANFYNKLLDEYGLSKYKVSIDEPKQFLKSYLGDSINETTKSMNAHNHYALNPNEDNGPAYKAMSKEKQDEIGKSWHI